MPQENEQQQKHAPVFAIGLDGDLAQHTKYEGPDKIGPPIPAAVEMVKHWLAEGRKVAVITPRLAHNAERIDLALPAIMEWCNKHLGMIPELTCTLTPDIVKFYSWRNGTLTKNTGAIAKTPVTALFRVWERYHKAFPLDELSVTINIDGSPKNNLVQVLRTDPEHKTPSSVVFCSNAKSLDKAADEVTTSLRATLDAVPATSVPSDAL